MSVVSKGVQAVRLLPTAAYSLYFDLVGKDPDHLAKSARAAVRDTYFASRCKIRSIAVAHWLDEQDIPVAATFKLPSQAMYSDGVGDAAFYGTLAMISAAVRPRSIVEFGTFLGTATAGLVMNSDSRMLTINLRDEVSPADLRSLRPVDLTLA